MFLFQTGAIKRKAMQGVIRSLGAFLFQTGAIKRLSKTDIYIIPNPYSTCQVYFHFSCFLRWVCSRPPIVQILWEVDGSRYCKGLEGFFGNFDRISPQKKSQNSEVDSRGKYQYPLSTLIYNRFVAGFLSIPITSFVIHFASRS